MKFVLLTSRLFLFFPPVFSHKTQSLVLLSLYTAGREPEHFPDPEAAKPERWQRNEETGELREVLQSHGSLPFAIGNRSCIGRRMAMKQMHCLLASVSAHHLHNLSKQL